MNKFRHVLEMDGERERLRLGGVIDVDSNLSAIANELSAKQVVIELADIERVTSGGVVAWKSFTDSLLGRDVELVLERCSAAVVALLNRPDSPTYTVKSFALPYFCPECDEPRSLWAQVDEFDGPPYESKVQRCEVCDLVMQFDDNPKQYFAFLDGDRATRIRAATADLEIDEPNDPEPVTEEGARPFVVLLLIAAIAVALTALALFFS